MLWDVGSIAEIQHLIEASPVDVVLMDLNLGSDQDALAATTRLRESYEWIKVIVISGSLDWEAAAAARKAGASGYLPKDIAVVDMVAAIRELASPTMGVRGFSNMLGSRPATRATLISIRGAMTKREQEVLAELRRGRTNKEIADRFGVSIPTVNKHVQQVLRKLHVGTRGQAVAKVNAAAIGRPYPFG